MVRFQCDSCGRNKEENDVWILGFAAENIGVTSARREVSIAGMWERARAVEPLAVHFCSDECRARYMEALFGDTPDTLQGKRTVPKKRIQRVIPGEVVETMVAEKKGPVLVRKTALTKKRA